MKLSILGATGSIGLQTLDIVRTCLPQAQITALSGFSNIEKLAQLAIEFTPQIICVPTETAAKQLRGLCGNIKEIIIGEDGLKTAAAETNADTVVNALVGKAGLAPTLAAIEKGKNIALANKETLVTVGELVMKAARKKNIRITPIDSEHSAIWQCLGGDITAAKDTEKIILTASGGPFRTWERPRIAKATARDALKHPNWSMGDKITIDSATLMNKGLEFIEAMHLFNMPPQKIEILIHPQSIVHSMVQYTDGSVMAQMGLPDMRLPILYALSAPQRIPTPYPRMDFLKCGALTFHEPNEENFPCLALAKHAATVGGTLPAVMNYLNEYAVGEYLREKITFYDISQIIEQAFGIYKVKEVTSIDDIREAEAWAEEFIKKWIRS